MGDGGGGSGGGSIGAFQMAPHFSADDSLPQANCTAVAIDKDKPSQYAARWAIDHLLTNSQHVILIHVRQRSLHHRRYLLSFIIIIHILINMVAQDIFFQPSWFREVGKLRIFRYNK